MRRMTLAGLVLGLGTSVGEAALTKPEPPSASDDVITVMPVNDPPVAGDDHVTLTGPGSIKLSLTANDTDVDGVVVPNSLTIMTPPRQGEVRVTYTPAPGSSGRDAFSYIVWDDRGARSNAAAVFLERR